MRRASEELLAWLFSAACLIYILRSIKQVLLPAGGFLRSPFVMFTAGALFAVAWTAIAVVCSILFLTERCRPKPGPEDPAGEAAAAAGAPSGRRGASGVQRRPFLLRRRAAVGGDGPPAQLVTTHPSAVRQGSFAGPVWLVPATLWARGQLASEWPPPTQGPAAVARKFHATLLRPGPGSRFSLGHGTGSESGTGPPPGPGAGLGVVPGPGSGPGPGPAGGPGGGPWTGPGGAAAGADVRVGVAADTGSGSGALLVLVPERAGRGGKAVGPTGASSSGSGSGSALMVPLDGVAVDLMRDVLGKRSPWTRRCPLLLSHPSRPLLLGETVLYMFAESGSAKEQWYAALTAAVAPQSLLAATQQLYADYCRHMTCLQVVQPPPLPPTLLPLAQPGSQPQQPDPKALVQQQQQQQQQQVQQQRSKTQGPQQQMSAGKGAAAAPARKAPPQAPPTTKDRQRTSPPSAKGAAGDASASASAPAPPPRPRGRNPFGFILSRFGRGAPRGATASDVRPAADAPATASAPASASAPATAPSLASASGAGSAPPSRAPSISAPSPCTSPQRQSAADLQQLLAPAAVGEEQGPAAAAAHEGREAGHAGGGGGGGTTTTDLVPPVLPAAEEEAAAEVHRGAPDAAAAAQQPLAVGPFSRVTEAARGDASQQAVPATNDMRRITLAVYARPPAAAPGVEPGALLQFDPGNVLEPSTGVTDTADAGAVGARLGEESLSRPLQLTSSQRQSPDSTLALQPSPPHGVRKQPSRDHSGDPDIFAASVPFSLYTRGGMVSERTDCWDPYLAAAAAALPVSASVAATSLAAAAPKLAATATVGAAVEPVRAPASAGGGDGCVGRRGATQDGGDGTVGQGLHSEAPLLIPACVAASEAAHSAAAQAALDLAAQVAAPPAEAGAVVVVTMGACKADTHGAPEAAPSAAAAGCAIGVAAVQAPPPWPPPLKVDRGLRVADHDYSAAGPGIETERSQLERPASPPVEAVATPGDASPPAGRCQGVAGPIQPQSKGPEAQTPEGYLAAAGEVHALDGDSTGAGEARGGSSSSTSTLDVAGSATVAPMEGTAAPPLTRKEAPSTADLVTHWSSDEPSANAAAGGAGCEAANSPLSIQAFTTDSASSMSLPPSSGPETSAEPLLLSPPLPPLGPLPQLPPVPLGQQSRHGGSMPNLLVLAAGAATAVAGAGTADPARSNPAPVDPLRRSLDQHLAALQQPPPPAATLKTVSGTALAGVGGASGGGCGGGASVPAMPRSLSKQDLRRLQREEQERAKQAQQRAKAAARAAEEARRAEERAARERARAEAQQRRQAEEAQARLAKERARSAKQMRSAKSLQDLAAATVAAAETTAAGAPASASATPPPSARSSVPGVSAADPAAAAAAGVTPAAASPTAPSLVGVPPTVPGARAEGAKGTAAPGPVPIPAPAPPSHGALVEGLHGLNMLLVRIGFELLRRRGFEAWLGRIIQAKLDLARRPGFLHRLTLRGFDLGCSAPQLRDIRAVAGPNNFGPGSATWPQLALQVVWVGNASATIATKIDFDQSAQKAAGPPASPGSATAAPATSNASASTTTMSASGPDVKTASRESHGGDNNASAGSSGAFQPNANPQPPDGPVSREASAAGPSAIGPAAAASAGRSLSTHSLAAFNNGGVNGELADTLAASGPAVDDGAAGAPESTAQGEEGRPDGISGAPMGTELTEGGPRTGAAGTAVAGVAKSSGTASLGAAATACSQGVAAGTGAKEISGATATAGGASTPGSGRAPGDSDGGAQKAGAAAADATTTTASTASTASKASTPDGGGGGRPASTSSAGGGSASGGSGGGKFWWNFVPFFSILRKTGQALASNIAGSLSGTPVEVRLAGRRFEGTLLLWLAPPPSDRLWLSFAEPPSMDFTVTPVLGTRSAGGLVVGRLSAWVRAKVIAGLTRAMVYPACVDVRLGKLLLSIDSPEDAVRAFAPPAPPPPGPPPTAATTTAATAPAAAAGPRDGQRKPQQQPQQQQPQQPAATPIAAADGIGPEGSSASFTEAGPSAAPSGAPSRPSGRPPRPPLSSTPTCTTPTAMGLAIGTSFGARPQASASVPVLSPPPAPQLFSSASLPAQVPVPVAPPTPAAAGTFSAAALAAATAAGLGGIGGGAGGGGGSLLESALRTVLRHTPSILGSSPGTLSPLDGLSDAEEDEEEEWEVEEEGEHEGGEQRWQGGAAERFYDEEGRAVSVYAQYGQYGNSAGAGVGGAEGLLQYGYGQDAVDASYFWAQGPGVPPPHSSQAEAFYGGARGTAPAADERGSDGGDLLSPLQLQRRPRTSAGSASASASAGPASAVPASSSVSSFSGRVPPSHAPDGSHNPAPRGGQQPPHRTQQQQGQATAAGARGGPIGRRGPLQWARGAAGAVARGVGSVGGVGMRGLGVVGAAVGQAVLGPVVHAGERAALQQQRQASAALPSLPSGHQLLLPVSASSPALSAEVQQKQAQLPQEQRQGQGHEAGFLGAAAGAES